MDLALSFVVSTPPFPMDKLLDDFSVGDGDEQESAAEMEISAATAGGAALKSANGVWRG